MRKIKSLIRRLIGFTLVFAMLVLSAPPSLAARLVQEVPVVSAAAEVPEQAAKADGADVTFPSPIIEPEIPQGEEVPPQDEDAASGEESLPPTEILGADAVLAPELFEETPLFALLSSGHLSVGASGGSLSVSGTTPYTGSDKDKDHKVIWSVSAGGGGQIAVSNGGSWDAGSVSVAADTYFSVSATLWYEKWYEGANENEGDWAPMEISLGSDGDFIFHTPRPGDCYEYLSAFYGGAMTDDNGGLVSGMLDNTTVFISGTSASKGKPAALAPEFVQAIETCYNLGVSPNVLLSGAENQSLYTQYQVANKEYGEPVDTYTGQFTYTATDLSLLSYGGRFEITRSYASGAGQVVGLFGRNWTAKGFPRLIRGDGSTYLAMLDDGMVSFEGPGEAVGSDGSLYALSTRQDGYLVENRTLGNSFLFTLSGKPRTVTDAKGHETNYGYVGYGQLSTITLDTGDVLQITADPIYPIIYEIALPSGAKLQFEYDDDMRLIKVCDLAGYTLSYTYDKKGNMTGWTDQNGVLSVENEYDDKGRVIRQVDGDGRGFSMEYGLNSSVFTDGEGRKTSYTFDDAHNPVRVEYPDGTAEKWTYDAQRRPVSFADGDGNVFSYGYDALGNLATIMRPDGSSCRFVWSEKHELLSYTDYAGGTTGYEYDSRGNRTRETRADGSSRRFEYNANGKLTLETDWNSQSAEHAANGGETVYSYSGAALSSRTDARGYTWRYSYDKMGNLLKEIDPLNNETSYGYDARGFLTKVTRADGSTLEYGYDKNGNLVWEKDARGNRTEYSYDSMDALTQVRDAMGQYTGLELNATYAVEKLTDTAGNPWEIGLDGRDRAIKLTDPEGYTTAIAYNANGLAISQTDARGNEALAKYDPSLGLVVQSVDRLGQETGFSHDKNGNVTGISYPNGSAESFAYDALNRLIRYSDQSGLRFDYGYDDNSNLLWAKDSGGREWSYQYDRNNNRIEAMDPLGQTIAYAYDELNRLNAYTDEEGSTTAYAYDALGRITGITDALQRETRIAYDGNGNVVLLKDAKGNETSYTYDTLNRLIKVEDALSGTTGYAYDAAGNLTRIADANGNETGIEYDRVGNAIQLTDALNGKYAFEYDGNGNLIAFTDANGNRTSLIYDEENRQTESTDALGLTEKRSYDALGNIAQILNNAGSRMDYEYDPAGRLIKQTDALGRESSFLYDLFGQVVENTAFDGGKWSYAYDLIGRVTGATDPLGRLTSLAYDAVGNLTGVTNNASSPDEQSWLYHYDSAGRLLKAADPQGGNTQYAYDENDNLTTWVDAQGNKNLFAYDALSRLVRQTDGRGNDEEYGYDALSNLLSVQDREGNETSYAYDALGRVTQQTDALGGITRYGYDALGNLISKTDAENGVWTAEYSAHNRVILEKDALSFETSYLYDLNGNLLKKTNPLGAEQSYAYDPLQRLTKITDALGFEISLAYNPQGDVEAMTDSLGRATTFSYDAMHRLLSITDAMGGETRYGYDGMDNLLEMTTPAGRKYAYEYDLLGQVVKEIDPLGSITQYGHDAVGNLLTVKNPDGGEMKLGYDENGNLTALQTPLNERYAFSYDGNDNRTAETTPQGNTTRYAYDALGNMTQRSGPTGAEQTYSYDKLSRVTVVSDALGNETGYSYDALSRLTGVKDSKGNESSYGYDAAGNLISSSVGGVSAAYSYDLNGNLLQWVDGLGQIEAYGYDIAGRLTSYAKGSQRTIYDYDALDRLLLANTQARAESGKTMEEEERYAYDADGLLTEATNKSGSVRVGYDARGEIISVTQPDGSKIGYEYDESGRVAKMLYPDGSYVRYSYDLNGKLLSVKDSRGNETAYTYTPDGLAQTKTTNGVQTSYSYDAAGRLLKESTELNGEEVSFTYSYDETGNILSETAVQGGDVWVKSYTYDARDQLTGYSASGSFDGEDISTQVAYAYDARGNLVLEVKDGERTEYRYNEADQLVQRGDTAYAYDDRGNLVEEAVNGEWTLRYNYDAKNRLVAIHESGEVDERGDDITRKYGYDALGNRLYEQRFYNKRVKTGTNLIQPEPVSITVENWLTKTFGDKGAKEEEEGAEEIPPEQGEAPGGKENDAASPGTDDGDAEGGKEAPEVQESSGSEGVLGDGPSFFWYGFWQSLVRTLTPFPAGEWLSAAWHAIWQPEGETTGENTGHETIGGMEDEEDDEASSGEGEEPIWEDYLSDVLGEDVEDIELEEAGDGDAPRTIKEKRLEEVTLYPDALEEEEWETLHKYELIWYINDINQENTQVLMTRGEGGAYTRSYSYGNERLTWSYGSWRNKRGAPTITGQYVYDGRGSVAMVADVDTKAPLIAHYYGAYGETLTADYLSQMVRNPYAAVLAQREDASAGCKGFTREERKELKKLFALQTSPGMPQAGMWDGYGYNGEAYDERTELSYLRARTLDVGTHRFLTADTVKGNVYQPLSQNLYGYVLGNPVRYVDPSGHMAVGEGADPVSYAKCGSKDSIDARLTIIGEQFKEIGYETVMFIPNILISIWDGFVDRGAAAQEDPSVFNIINLLTAGIAGGIVDTAKTAFDPSASVLERTLAQLGLASLMFGVYTAAGGTSVLNPSELGQALSRDLPTYGYTKDAAAWADDAGIQTASKSIEDAGNRFGPMNKGPLPDSVSNTFRSGTYSEVILAEDTILYRVYGGTAAETGSYYTRILQNGGMQSQIDLALNPAWGNTATGVASITIPKGTVVYEGYAASQAINGGAGQLLGGGNQIFIPR